MHTNYCGKYHLQNCMYLICMIMSAAISRVQNKCYENIMYRQYTRA